MDYMKRSSHTSSEMKEFFEGPVSGGDASGMTSTYINPDRAEHQFCFDNNQEK